MVTLTREELYFIRDILQNFAVHALDNSLDYTNTLAQQTLYRIHYELSDSISTKLDESLFKNDKRITIK